MRKFFITGTSKGIGKALAEALLNDSKNEVIGISRSNYLAHPRFEHVAFNLEDVNKLAIEVEGLFKVDKHFDRISLVNNAGYLGNIKYFGDVEDTEFVKVFNTNVTAPAIMINAFIRQFKEASCEKLILNIGSGAGRHPYDGWGAYCASKSAIDMLTSVADMENTIREGNFKIVSLAPGPVETGMQDQVRSTDVKDFSHIDKFISLKKSGGLPSPEAIAENIISFMDQIDEFEGPLLDIRKLNINPKTAF